MKRRWDSDSGINQFRHSRRIVPIRRSQIAFISGLCGADFNTLYFEGSNRLVEVACEYTVTIVNQEFVRSSYPTVSLTQLLQPPSGTRMGRDVAVDQTTAAMPDHDKPQLERAARLRSMRRTSAR